MEVKISNFSATKILWNSNICNRLGMIILNVILSDYILGHSISGWNIYNVYWHSKKQSNYNAYHFYNYAYIFRSLYAVIFYK